MMRKNFFALTILAAAFGLASCNPDDPTGGKTPAAADLDYSSENATAWHNYLTQVASLLKDDAATLYAAWSESYEGGAAYAESFKNHTWSSDKKAVAGIEQIIDGCITIAEDTWNAVVTQYVDHVVMPTYLALKEKNETLYNKVKELAATPSNEAFEAACNAWLEAREPWEMSEAFLFGPVDALGLDPNLDSWPLDQDAIVQILTSSDWGALEWTEDSEAEAAQSVRGFHTLEYLLFKDGKPRRVK